MRVSDKAPNGTARCANCGERPGTVRWVGEGGALAISHGFYTWWCERCALEAQIAYAKQAVGRVVELQRKLDELTGRSVASERVL